MLADQLNMLGAKSDSLSADFTRIRKMLDSVVDESYLHGLEGGTGQAPPSH